MFTGDRLSPRDTWYRIVRTYSRSKLTKPRSDRILALAGVGKEVREVIYEANEARCNPGHQYEYVAGWWLWYIHVGLLWEQRDVGPRKSSLCGAPTWSWAAGLNPIHWRNPMKDMKNACDVKGLLSKDEYSGRGIALSLSPEDNLHDVDNEFACLILRGKVRLLLVGDKLHEEDCKKFADYTGVPQELISRWSSWSDPERPTEHIGWADIEQCTTIPSTTRPNANQVVLALHVATQEKVERGLQYGYLGMTHEVYCVLFKAPLDASNHNITYRYVRSGVGRIFKKGLFRNAEEIDVELAQFTMLKVM